MSHLSEWTARRFDIPEESVGGTRIVISGRSEVLIENSQGIAGVTTELVLIKLPSDCIGIHGKSLTIRSLSREVIAVSGSIDYVNLREGRC